MKLVHADKGILSAIAAMSLMLSGTGSTWAQGDDSFYFGNFLEQYPPLPLSFNADAEIITRLRDSTGDPVALEAVELYLSADEDCSDDTIEMPIHVRATGGSRRAIFVYDGDEIEGDGLSRRFRFDLSRVDNEELWYLDGLDDAELVLVPNGDISCLNVGSLVSPQTVPGSRDGVGAEMGSTVRTMVGGVATDRHRPRVSVAIRFEGRSLSDDAGLSRLEIDPGTGVFESFDHPTQDDSILSLRTGLDPSPVRIRPTKGNSNAVVRFKTELGETQTGRYQEDIADGVTWVEVETTSQTRRRTTTKHVMFTRPKLSTCGTPDLKGRQLVWSWDFDVRSMPIRPGVSRHGFQETELRSVGQPVLSLGEDLPIVTAAYTTDGGTDDDRFVMEFDEVVERESLQTVRLHVCEEDLDDGAVRTGRGGRQAWWPSVLHFAEYERVVLTASREVTSTTVDMTNVQAIRIAPGEGWTTIVCTIDSCLHDTGRTRWFVAALSEGETYQVSVRGMGDTTVKLRNAAGEHLGEARGHRNGGHRMAYTAEESGDVYIETSGVNGIRIGELGTAKDLDEQTIPSEDCSDSAGIHSCLIRLNGVTTARIGPKDNDRDHWHAHLSEGKSYTIRVEPMEGRYNDDFDQALRKMEVSLFERNEDGSLVRTRQIRRSRDNTVEFTRNEATGGTLIHLEVAGESNARGMYRVVAKEYDPDQAGLIKASIADTSAVEGPGAELRFPVTLNTAATSAISIDYTVTGGTATREDYGPEVTGRVWFRIGDRSKDVVISVVDDHVDEPDETVVVELSNVHGAAVIDRRQATGTISNTDSLPKEWTVRVGRAVAEQVSGAISRRLEMRERSHIVVASRKIMVDRMGTPAESLERHREPGSHLEDLGDPDEILATSRFHLTSAAPGEGVALSAWGEVARSGFSAKEGRTDLDAAVTSAMLGADFQWDGFTAGALVAKTRAEGGAGTAKDLSASLTGLYPYAQAEIGDDLRTWVALGAASGTVDIEPRQETGSYGTGMNVQMGAIGAARTRAVDAWTFTFEADGLWTRTRTDGTSRLKATEGETHRLRIEATARHAWRTAGGASFTPEAAIALRRDGGDAEVGTGVEARAGFGYEMGRLELGAGAQATIAHENDDWRNWSLNASATLAQDPFGRGLSMSIRPSWGQTTAPEAGQAWNGVTLPESREADGGVDARVSYTIHANGSVVTPYMEWSSGHDGWGVGTRWRLASGADVEIVGEKDAARARLQVRF